MSRFILLFILIVIISCRDTSEKETNNCENSIIYEFIGVIDKDSLKILPTKIDVNALGHKGELMINDCYGNASLNLFDKQGNIIVSGSFLGGEALEKIESDWLSSDIYDTQVDTIEVYKTFINGNWNFKKVKVKIGGEYIE